jgi:hypothetical protein
MPTTKIAHVLAYPKPNVTCCFGTHSFDFWRTGTVRRTGTGFGTCNPTTKHFDLILSNDSAVQTGAQLQITYNEQGSGAVKQIVGLGITPAPQPHAFAFNVLGLLDIKSEIDSVEDGDGEPASGLLPARKWRASITLFDRYRFAFDVGRFSHDDEVRRRYERGYLHIPPGASPPDEGGGESDKAVAPAVPPSNGASQQHPAPSPSISQAG